MNKNQNRCNSLSFPDDLPVETVVIDIPEEKKVSAETGLLLPKIGEEITNKLAYRPGSYYIKRIIRPKYGAGDEGIRIADLYDSIIPRCRVDESLLAEICTRKFADHLPLNRIQEILERDSIHIPRQLLSQWVIRIGNALIPLVNEMKNHILSSGNVFMDETPIDLQVKGLGKSHSSYVFLLAGGRAADPPYRIYSFRTTRKHKHIPDILEDYRGVLHSDKYGGYEVLAQRKQVIWCPCYAHIRRKFEEAEAGDPVFRQWILEKMQSLFLLEREAFEKSEEERLSIRKEKEEPIIDEMVEEVKRRLLGGKALPKSKYRQALGYFYGLVPHLKNYLTHPYARIDNNVAERALHPLTVGRKNWLFFGSEAGGKAAAAIYSLVQTCRGLGINPREYLEWVFRQLMSQSTKKLKELLPDQWQKEQES